MVLFRPVGLKELELIASLNWKGYPPRLAWQPIFYPVLTIEYARSILTNWNSQEADAGYCGFITHFEIDDNFVSRYPVQQLGGGPNFRELWVPAEELPLFNQHIQGTIRVIETLYGSGFSGQINPATRLPVSVLEAEKT